FQVTEEVEGTRFNTGISATMEFVNMAYRWTYIKRDRYPRSIVEAFTLLLSLYAPHLAEELCSWLGHSELLAYESFPEV
ncbi:Leucine--tRNA ligase, chloroplastic/mitochondrial, partial [Cucurbita argyrosperma subsp. argyrosperma]